MRWTRAWALLTVAALLVACNRGEAPTAKPAEAQKPLPADAGGIVELFRARGLPIGQAIIFTAENDPNSLLGRPNQYTSKATFLDTRLPREQTDKIDSGDGGTVEVFSNEADAKARHDHTGAISKSSPMFAEYGFLNGKALLRLSRRLTPDQASQYETLLKDPGAQITLIPAATTQAAPTAAPKPAGPQPTEAPKPAAQRVRVTGAGAEGVNMRAEPSTSAARVKLLRDGAQLEIVGEDRQADGRTWRNVKDPSDGASGWIAAEFVAAAQAAPAAQPAQPTAAPPPPATQQPPPQPAQQPPPPAPTAIPKVVPQQPAPGGGTIVCRDGYVWPSSTRQGACSRHGGIAPGY